MRIDHAALFCKDLEGMRQFFMDHFEVQSNELYHNLKTGLRTYILSFPDEGARLEIMSRPDTIDIDPAQRNIGFIHLSFSVGSKEAVDIRRRNSRVLDMPSPSVPEPPVMAITKAAS